MEKFSFQPAFDATTMTIKVSVSNQHETPRFVEIDWPAILDCVRHLIELRVKHCEQQLASATLKGETSFNEHNPQIIYFKNGGHFSVPTYEAMVNFLSIEMPSKSDLTQGVAQQALRQYMLVLRKKKFDNDSRSQFEMLRDLSRDQLQLLENVLTEILLCGTPA